MAKKKIFNLPPSVKTGIKAYKAIDKALTTKKASRAKEAYYDDYIPSNYNFKPAIAAIKGAVIPLLETFATEAIEHVRSLKREKGEDKDDFEERKETAADSYIQDKRLIYAGEGIFRIVSVETPTEQPKGYVLYDFYVEEIPANILSPRITPRTVAKAIWKEIEDYGSDLEEIITQDYEENAGCLTPKRENQVSPKGKGCLILILAIILPTLALSLCI